MLKKIMSLLFEEVEVVEEATTPALDLEPAKPAVLEVEEPQIEASYVTEAVKAKPKSIFVDSDDKLDVEPPKTMSQPTQPKTEFKPKTDYEFSSNISPIFGRIPEKEREPIQVQAKIELEAQESVIGTIISPIYGVKTQRPAKVKVEKPVSMSGNPSLEDILEISEPMESTIEQMTLTEAVIKEETAPEADKEDILMQLFKEDEA